MRLFGTDGIRGEVGKYPLTAENALKLAKASSLVLRKKNSISRVVINKDTRLSGYIFEPALASGFISMGIDVILVGPYDFDNFKIKPSNYGKAIRLKNALGRYSEALKQNADRNLNYSKLKVTLDCANGASYKVAPEVLFELGLDLYTIGNNPSGININQNCGSLFPQKASGLVKKKKCDIGICLDGDGDRVVIIDEKGKVLSGEELIYILAKYYLSENKIKKGSIVVTNEIANYGLDISLKKLGLKLKRVKVGDKNILKQIIDHKYFFGGEPSGHFIFKDDILIGDGMTTAIRLLTLILKKNKKLSELRKGIDLFEVININQRIDREKFYLSQESIYQKLNKLFKNLDIYYNIRPSGTEPLLRVNLQYEKRNIKVSILKKLKTQIIKVISDAC